MTRFLAILALIAGSLLIAPPVFAQAGNMMWQCKETTPVGWCPVSATNPLPTTGGGGGGGGTSSDFGDPFPTDGTAAGFLDSTGDMAPLELEADGSIPVTVIEPVGQDTMANSVAVTMANNQSTIEVDGAGVAGTPAGGVLTIQGATSMEPVQAEIVDSGGTPLTYNANGQATMANSSPIVIASNQSALDVGAGTAGTADASVVTVQGVASMTPVQVSQATAASLNATVVGTGTFAVQSATTPVTSGGLSWYFVQPAASDNHVVIKAGAGQVYNIQAFNNSATVNYLRLYNATTGFNGCNSATNLVGQWQIPANTAVGGFSVTMDNGLAFATGISICVTSGYATTDTTNATATAMSINVGYK